MTSFVRAASAMIAALFALWPMASGAVDQPGQHFEVLPSQLPPPGATPAVDNSSEVIPRPQGAMPKAPAGFTVSVFASDLEKPRLLSVAPNGDVFVAEPDKGEVLVLAERGGHLERKTFASGFKLPHGMAFHDGAFYVADHVAVWKLGYRDGALKAGARTRVTKDSFGPEGGHFTRDIAFGPDGKLYLAIGSKNNIEIEDPPRATVQLVSLSGKLSTFASGLRNPVGIAFYPGSNDLWVTVNERDGLGDGLPPDYMTHIAQGEFFGWPYAYIGPHPDPDPIIGTKRPDLVAKTKTPNLLFQAHSAPLGFLFYQGSQFPSDYKGDAFVALHGSWNSGKPTGYKVVRIKFKNGQPAGGYENFLTGFWDGSSSPAQVWGRPVWPAIAKDGSLLISDDVGNTIWRVAYTGK